MTHNPSNQRQAPLTRACACRRYTIASAMVDAFVEALEESIVNAPHLTDLQPRKRHMRHLQTRLPTYRHTSTTPQALTSCWRIRSYAVFTICVRAFACNSPASSGGALLFPAERGAPPDPKVGSFRPPEDFGDSMAGVGWDFAWASSRCKQFMMLFRMRICEACERCQGAWQGHALVY